MKQGKRLVITNISIVHHEWLEKEAVRNGLSMSAVVKIIIGEKIARCDRDGRKSLSI